MSAERWPFNTAPECCEHCSRDIVMHPPLRDVHEAAEWLRISASKLQKLVAARLVPFTFVGRQVRFTQEHLDAIVAAGEQQPIVPPSLALVRRGHPPSGPQTPPPPPGPRPSRRSSAA